MEVDTGAKHWKHCLTENTAFVDSDDSRAIASPVATNSNKRIKDNTLQATNDIANEYSLRYS